MEILLELRSKSHPNKTLNLKLEVQSVPLPGDFITVENEIIIQVTENLGDTRFKVKEICHKINRELVTQITESAYCH